MTKTYEQNYIALQTAFTHAKADKHLVLDSFDLISLRPTANLTSSAILQAAKAQNLWCNESAVTILRGIKDVDILMDIKGGEGGEQRTMRQFLKGPYITTKDGSNPDLLLKQAELATYNRVYLFHKTKVHMYAVKVFLQTVDAQLKISLPSRVLY